MDASTSPNFSIKSHQEPLILRGYWRSSATWRVRIALHLKGIDFDDRPVHLIRDGGEQHHADYTRLNPLAQVPTLQLPDGALLTQSLAIIDYLEQLYPSPPLYPKDPLQRARAIQLAEIVNSGIQPLQNLSLLQKISRDYQADKAAWGREVIARGLSALETILRSSAPEANPSGFLIGDEPTIADLCLIPQLYNARRFKVDLSNLPRLLIAEEACAQLPAFMAAHPDVQRDAQT
jgi:maleylpyruvate isomerase